MLYRPAQGHLWDTWIFRHPRDGRYHLFYLGRQSLARGTEWVDHAVSEDLLHWDLVERFDPLGGFIGTGMVFQDGDLIRMSLTDMTVEPHVIRFFTARDQDGLRDWHIEAGKVLSLPTGSANYYGPGSALPKLLPDFRDAHIVPRGDGLHAFIAASRPDTPVGGMGCVAHAVSSDLSTWKFLSPVTEPAGLYQMEVPDHCEINGWHYLFVSDVARGIRYDDEMRSRSGGTFYLMSRRFEGPYRLPANGLLLGGESCASLGPSVYVGRALAHEDGHLMYHHHFDGALGLPKRIVQDAAGRLQLAAWEKGIAALRQGPWDPGSTLTPLGRGPRLAGTWEQAEEAVRGRCERGNHYALWGPAPDDLELAADLAISTAGKAGFILRFSPDGQVGLVAAVDRARGTVGVERIESKSVWHPLANCCPLDEVRLPIGERVRLRVLVRAQYVEVYLDDRWLLASHWAQDMPSGSCGLFVADGHATFTNREAHVLRPLLASELRPYG